MTLSLESLDSISPLQFFKISQKILFAEKPSSLKNKKFELLNTEDLIGEHSFSKVKMGWNQDALLFEIELKKPFEDSVYPDFKKGDSVELFIDTRDLKNAGFFHKFCHHFLFLPKAVSDIQAQEISRFRTEDSHPICDFSDLFIETDFDDQSFVMKIKIGKEALFGFEPEGFPKIGFTYRINRPSKPAQHFAISSLVEQHPALWASLVLET